MSRSLRQLLRRTSVVVTTLGLLGAIVGSYFYAAGERTPEMDWLIGWSVAAILTGAFALAFLAVEVDD